MHESPSPDPFSSIQTDLSSQPTPPPLRSKGRLPSQKRIALIFGAALVLIGGLAAAWFFLTPSDDTPPSTSSTPTQTSSSSQSVAPRFTSIRGYASFKGAQWYAADGGVIRIQQGKKPTYYTQRDGVPQGYLTALVVHKDRLWVSSQSDVATLKADGSGFATANTGTTELRNGQLYADHYANKLYLSGFSDFYAWDDTRATWEKQAGPQNFHSVAINKDFIVGTVNGQNMEVWVYTKATDKWRKQKPAGIDNQTVQQAFTIGNDLFAMGRSTGYTSCEQQGTVTASSVYHLDSAGDWQPLTTFNTDVSRKELIVGRHLKDSASTFYTSDCDGGKPTKYSVTYREGTLQLKDLGTITNGGSTPGDDGEQALLIAELRKATGLYPFIRVLDVDAKGNLVFGYGTRPNSSSVVGLEGIAVAKGSDFTHAQPIKGLDTSEKLLPLIPILCEGKLSYAFTGEYAYQMAAEEGFPNGKWSKAELLRIENNTAVPFVDLQGEVGEPRFACAKGKISWVGQTGFQQLDIASKKITATGSNLPATSALQTQTVSPVANGDLWALLPVDETKNDKTASLYHFSAANRELKKIGTYPAVALLGGTTTHAWVAEHTAYAGGDTFSSLAIYDLAGSKTTRTGNFLRLGLISDTKALVADAANNPSQSIFIPFTVSTYTLGGTSSTMNPAKIPMRNLQLGITTEDSGYTHNGGLYDTTRKQLWFSDDMLGSFAVKP